MFSCGVDIVDVNRIQQLVEENKEQFLKRVYTQEEIQYCESRRMCKYQSYAARFAAKEAVYKAISPDKTSGITWQEIEIRNQENGKPYVLLHGTLKQIAKAKGIEKIEISLSHEKEYAIANVMVIE